MKLILRLLVVWLAVSAPATVALADQGAEAFVRGLYDRYGTSARASSPLGPEASAIFDPALLALIRRDQTRAKGEAGLLDHDPICDCQDFGGLTALRLSMHPQGHGAAAVIAHFTISADQVTVRFQLVHTADGWRIADIQTQEIPSLRTFLTQRLAHG